jgi:TRAP-type C4-dicarboxylate transport system permease small subunit
LILQSFLTKLNWLADKTSQFTAYLAALVLLWLVGLTCVDVIGRYFFRAPVVGAVELVQLSMAGIIFLSLPMMFLKNDHVIVDLFSFKKHAWLSWGISFVLTLVMIMAIFVLADRVWDYAIRAYEDGDRTIYLHIPRYLTVGLVTGSIYLSGLFLCLRALHMILRPGTPIEQDTLEQNSMN